MPVNRRASVPESYEVGWLDQLDGRRNLSKQMRSRFHEIANDLGGVDTLSYAQRSLIERSLWLEYWLASQEQALGKGQEFDVSRWIQACNSLQGIFTRLGLERKAREAPDLQTYLKARESEA